jgi:hypothetical protein
VAARSVDFWEFGGVDSRSNPLNLPFGRALRARNWRPLENGILQLRDGFSTVTQSGTVSVAAIHTIIPYLQNDGTKLLSYFQGTNTVKMNISTGVITSPTMRGTAISSSSRWQYYLANGKIHAGNGTDQKFFDGTTWRDSGIRSLTAAEVLNVIIAEGVREHTTANLASVTLTAAAGTALSVSTKGGYLVYSPIYDTVEQELGPATLPVRSTTRLAITAAGTSFVTVAVLPDLSAVNANWVKLVARTDDGGDNAYFVTTTSTAATLTRASSTITLSSTSHGLIAGDVFIASGFTDTDYNRVWCVASAPDANTITVTLGSSQIAANFSASDTGGTIKKILKVANATTTGTINVATKDTSYIVNQSLGIAATSVGGAQPGYLFFASIANTGGGGHVGNRLQIGGRKAPATRCNFRITGLPDLSGSDTEWSIKIGRSGDGGQIPYSIIDSAGNFKYAGNTDTVITIVDSAIDGTDELPTRNGIIPAACNLFAAVGDVIYAADTGSPTIRRSGSQSDDNQGYFCGRPEQSWQGNDIETFPTAEPVTCIAENDYELLCFTKNDSAVLSDLSGIRGWRGPWNVGCAGARAFCKAGPWGFFWLTGDKQLASIVNGAPTPVSSEYEATLLGQLLTSSLSTVEMTYQNEPDKGIDRIMISGLDASSVPIQIYHDFKLRDERSSAGQGYDSVHVGQLATAFVTARVRNSTGKQVTWAGTALGQLMELNNGANDGGTEFTANYYTLLNGAVGQPNLSAVQWFGDRRVIVSIADSLDSTTSDLSPRTTEAVIGREDDFFSQAKLQAPNIYHLYLAFTLTSHSTDGSLALSTLPHFPIEDYGRIYGVINQVGKS